MSLIRFIVKEDLAKLLAYSADAGASFTIKGDKDKHTLSDTIKVQMKRQGQLVTRSCDFSRSIDENSFAASLKKCVASCMLELGL